MVWLSGCMLCFSGDGLVGLAAVSLLQETARGDDATIAAQLDAAPSVSAAAQACTNNKGREFYYRKKIVKA